MRLRCSLAAILLVLATSHLTAAVTIIGQVGRLFRADTTTQVPVGSIVLLVADTDKATQPGLVNPLGTTLVAGNSLGGASGDLIVGVYTASDLVDGIVGVDFGGGKPFEYDNTFTAGTDLWLVWFPGISTPGSQVGGAESYGAYRSATVDTASGSTIAFVAPANGSTSSLYAYTTSLGLGFGQATDAELSATQVTLTPHNNQGTYFGTFASGGNWALYVRADNTATYIAYLPMRHSAIVVNLTVGLNGTFSVAGIEARSPVVSAAGFVGIEVPPPPPVVASAFTLTGQIDANGAIAGQLSGLSETFTGTVDTAAMQAPAGLYKTSALNAASGATYAIVGPSGQVVVVTTGSAIDGAAGTVNASGQLTAVTRNNGSLALTINAAAQTVTATLTPSGSSTPISYAGLPDTVASTTRVVNLSVRSSAGSGDQTLIVGLVIAGSGNKTLLLRGVGPGISQSVSNALGDPRLRLLNGSTELDANDDWDSALTATFSSLGAAPLATGSKDAAIYRAIPAGLYTFHVFPSDTGTGVALAELYDGDTAQPTAQVVNISARTQVGTGNNVLIAGFVVTGNAPKTLLIRGQGPSLVGVTGVLADPQLSVFNKDNAVITSNDNWGGTAELKTAFGTVGASALASDTSKDAALLVTVQPGVYSAVVSGVGDTTGIGLVEIFLLP